MSSLSTLPKGDSAWLLRKAIERIIQQVSVLETNIGSSTTGNSSNTQVIFNDNGTLRGDPDLIFNTSQNKLVATALESTTSLFVGTSATITGDLTVDTSTLKVDSANNRVGIGTASPSYDLEIAGAVRSSLAIRGNFAGGTDIAHLRFINANGSIVGDIFSQNTNGGASDSAYLSFNTVSSGTSAERYRIAADGVATWSNVGGVAGTAMTLNSTGLGVGVTAAAGDGSGAFKAAGTGSLTANSRVGLDVRELVSGNQAGIILGAMTTENTAVIGSRTASGNIAFQTFNGASWGERMRIDYLGNVGIGVTPSAWGTGLKALQVGATGYGALFDFNNDVIAMSANLLWTGSAYNRISASSKYALAYYQDIGGSHQWAMSSAAGTNAVAPTMNTLMTLNANGNLVLKGGTAAANGVGVTFPATQVAASDANTLDDYEEGTFTPTITAETGTIGTTVVNSANYTKVGRLVSVTFDITITTVGTGAAGLKVSMPFSPSVAGNTCGALREYQVTGNMGQVYKYDATNVLCNSYNNSTLIVANYRIMAGYTYYV